MKNTQTERKSEEKREVEKKPNRKDMNKNEICLLYSMDELESVRQIDRIDVYRRNNDDDTSDVDHDNIMAYINANSHTINHFVQQIDCSNSKNTKNDTELKKYVEEKSE